MFAMEHQQGTVGIFCEHDEDDIPRSGSPEPYDDNSPGNNDEYDKDSSIGSHKPAVEDEAENRAAHEDGSDHNSADGDRGEDDRISPTYQDPDLKLSV